VHFQIWINLLPVIVFFAINIPLPRKTRNFTVQTHPTLTALQTRRVPLSVHSSQIKPIGNPPSAACARNKIGWILGGRRGHPFSLHLAPRIVVVVQTMVVGSWRGFVRCGGHEVVGPVATASRTTGVVVVAAKGRRVMVDVTHGIIDRKVRGQVSRWVVRWGAHEARRLLQLKQNTNSVSRTLASSAEYLIHFRGNTKWPSVEQLNESFSHKYSCVHCSPFYY